MKSGNEPYTTVARLVNQRVCCPLENMPPSHVLPPEILTALRECAGTPDRDVLDGVRRLSTLFTTGRNWSEGRAPDYLDARSLRRAYLLYFLPVNHAKVSALLREMPALPSRPLRILDLGSGPGTASLAVLSHMTQLNQPIRHGVDVIAVDRNRQALREAEALWHSMTQAPRQYRLCTVQADVEQTDSHSSWVQGSFDLIVLANSLNELFGSAPDPLAARVRLLTTLLQALAPDGTVMIVEPALRSTTRALHQVRDQLTASGAATVYSPCLHERPCPALVRPDDWCHEERPWTPPAVVQKIDRVVGFIKDALKFSYLLLRKDGLTIAERGSDVYRVVSDVMVMKGDRRAWLCNETGRPLVGRLEKARSEANAAFDRWHRGAIVRVEQIERRGAVGRIGREAQVELIRHVA